MSHTPLILKTVLSAAYQGIRDSVDSDDGARDGTCDPQTAGRCVNWFNGARSITFSATTGEDRFFGVQYAVGIRSISIRNSSGGCLAAWPAFVAKEGTAPAGDFSQIDANGTINTY